MATKVSLAVRSNEAYQRIEAATKKLAAALGVKNVDALDFRHRDPAIEQVTRIELLADNLEALSKSAKSKPVTDAPAAKGKAK